MTKVSTLWLEGFSILKRIYLKFIFNGTSNKNNSGMVCWEQLLYYSLTQEVTVSAVNEGF